MAEALVLGGVLGLATGFCDYGSAEESGGLGFGTEDDKEIGYFFDLAVGSLEGLGG